MRGMPRMASDLTHQLRQKHTVHECCSTTLQRLLSPTPPRLLEHSRCVPPSPNSRSTHEHSHLTHRRRRSASWSALAAARQSVWPAGRFPHDGDGRGRGRVRQGDDGARRCQHPRAPSGVCLATRSHSTPTCPRAPWAEGQGQGVCHAQASPTCVLRRCDG
jgi:hypothetical protein